MHDELAQLSDSMTKFQFDELDAQHLKIKQLTVLSYEMNHYFVQLQVNDLEALVYAGDRPMRFYSSQQIRDSFAPFQIESALMLHQSPYDELIGNPPSAQGFAALPFSMQQPY